MKKVLIVDDEVEICFLLAGILRKQGLNTNYVHSVKDGMDKIENNHYQTVFLDLNLPDGVGFQLIPAIKASDEETKVIIISAYDGIIERKNAMKNGADYFVSKPFSKGQVMKALNELEII